MMAWGSYLKMPDHGRVKESSTTYFYGYKVSNSLSVII